MPRTRCGNFYPILLSILKDQQGEMGQLSCLLSTQGLTTEQIGEVFEQLYAHHYSKQSISRLAHTAHQELLDWLDRPLAAYYPIIYSDCIFVLLRRGATVSREAIYTLLTIKVDQKREVLGMVCHPALHTFWDTILTPARKKGLWGPAKALQALQGGKGIIQTLRACWP